MPLAREKKQEVIGAVRRQGRRHRVARGPDRAPDGADPGPDGAPPPLPQGQPFAPRPPQARGSAPAPSRVSGEEGRHALSGRHRLAGTPPLGLATRTPGRETRGRSCIRHPAPEAPPPPAAGHSIHCTTKEVVHTCPLPPHSRSSSAAVTLITRDRPSRRQRRRRRHRSATATRWSSGPRTAPSPAPGSTSSRSPSTSRSGCTPPARSRAASSSARAARPRPRRSRRASRTARSARCSPRATRTTSRSSSPTLSTDHENELDVLGTIAASAALTISEIPFQGPIGAVHIGYIDGEFVLNPTHEPARRLAARPRRRRHPRRDHDGRGGRQDPARGRHGRGDHVRPPVDRPAHRPPGEAAREGRQAQAPAVPRARSPTPCSSSPSWRRRAPSSSSSTSRPPARDPKMADLVEVAAVRVKGGKITDRWSTFVNPGRPIVGNQMHGITDKDVKGAPTPAEAARKALDFVGDALARRPLGRLRHRRSSRRRSATAPASSRAATWTRSSIAREGYPDLENYKLGDAGQLLRGRAQGEPPRAAGRRGDRQPAALVRQRPARPDRRRSRQGIATAVRATRDRQGRVRRSCSRRPAARRASARACSGSCRRRSSASSSSPRASAWTAAPPTRSARSRSRSACSRVRTAPACSPAARPRP